MRGDVQHRQARSERSHILFWSPPYSCLHLHAPSEPVRLHANNHELQSKSFSACRGMLCLLCAPTILSPVHGWKEAYGVVDAPRRRLQRQQVVAADHAQQQTVLVYEQDPQLSCEVATRLGLQAVLEVQQATAGW